MRIAATREQQEHVDKRFRRRQRLDGLTVENPFR
jgi:hypothetical protein